MHPQLLADFWIQFTSVAARAASGGIPLLFRGETVAGRPLIPSIARGTRAGLSGDITNIEDDLMAEFKRVAAATLTAPPCSELEWLFLAQNYGLPTRLLDWTTNPLVGLFFAVEFNDDHDATLYFVQEPMIDQQNLLENGTVRHRQLGSFSFIRPKYSDQRYLNQKSVLMYLADPFKSQVLESLQTIQIDAGLKPELRRMLEVYGISSSFIYPGLQGIATEVKTRLFNPVQSGHLTIVTIDSTN